LTTAALALTADASNKSELTTALIERDRVMSSHAVPLKLGDEMGDENKNTTQMLSKMHI
jgi:hypothetical protein